MSITTDPDLVMEPQSDDAKLQEAVDAPLPEWREDPPGAVTYASTHSRDPRYPPHWVRCDFMRAGIRCRKGSGHEKLPGKQGEHEEPQP